MLDAECGADGAQLRRWRVLVSLAELFETWDGDYDKLAFTIADLITDQIGDRTAVLLLDPPGHSRPLFSVVHSRASSQPLADALAHELGDDGLRAWIHESAAGDERMWQTLFNPALPEGPEPRHQLLLRQYAERSGVSDVINARLRSRDGATRGLLICTRYQDSPAFDPVDRAVLTSAADYIGLGFDLAITHADARRAAAETHAYAERCRLLLGQLVDAEQAERQRIAHEVHDESMQLLAAAQLRLQLLVGQLAAGNVAAAGNAAAAIRDLVSAAQTNLRHLLVDLEPPDFAQRDLRTAVADTLRNFFAGTETSVAVVGSLPDVPNEVAGALFRCAREAISNARQHASARELTVAFSDDSTQWQLRVSDDGVGPPEPLPSPAGHLGLRGMARRAEALGGSFVLRRRAGGGTEVLITIPKAGLVSPYQEMKINSSGNGEDLLATGKSA